MTVAAFQELLADRLGVPAVCQELLAGFPPKLVQVCSNAKYATQVDSYLYCKSTGLPHDITMSCAQLLVSKGMHTVAMHYCGTPITLQ